MKHKLINRQPEIGHFIREFRLLSGLTQEQFAAYVGVTYPTVNRWENARSTPSPIALQVIQEKVLQLGEVGHKLLAKYIDN